MGAILGMGVTHYPLLAGTDEHMAGLLRWTLQDPDIPEEVKHQSSWPVSMRDDWADDGGTVAAGRHRKELCEQLSRCRGALDAFEPDLLVVWGDDQYENFREEVVPPFCVLAYDDVEVHPFELMNSRGSPNAWGLPDDLTFTLHGSSKLGRQLAEDLILQGFDMAYSYRPRPGAHFPHAITNTQLFLDYDHAGTELGYPIVAITVNCYGQHVIARRGGLARFADVADEVLDPVGPSPARCYALGAAVARAFGPTNLRVALVASSSWSHAFLCDHNWRLRPDTQADERLYGALEEGDLKTWQTYSTRELVAAGQHEMLNWFCLMGAVGELGLRRAWSSFVPSDVFNSNKCFAVFEEEGS